MIVSLRFNGQPPKPQQAPQPVKRQQPQAPQESQPTKGKEPAKAAEAEPQPETAPVPVPDFEAEEQGHICPFQSAVSVNHPNAAGAVGPGGKPFEATRVHRNGCYYKTRPDGKFDYDDVDYYKNKKGDVVDLDGVEKK